MEQSENNHGVRQLLILGMTRQQQIDFIYTKSSSFTDDVFASLTDKQVRDIALTLDKNSITDQ